MGEASSIPAASTEGNSCKSQDSSCLESDSGHRIGHRSSLATVLVVAIAVALLLVAPFDSAHAGIRPTSRPVVATWYGPGLYGNRFACAWKPGLPDRYGRNVRGVAHRTLPCGTWVTLRVGPRTVRVQVIDRGPYSGATFDLTARTAQDLCGCRRPFTMTVHYTRG